MASILTAYGLSGSVLAQTSVVGGGAQPTTAPGQATSVARSTSTVQEVVVTGSALPTTPDAVAVPVETINAESIAKAGVNSNELEVLRKEIPSFEGRGNAGSSNANNTNQNTAGGDQAQLRNLDTLVLVDGRRVAVDAIAGLGGKAFVDVSQIPAAAVERVEVLTDGSSAIYGSDAIGGVVNFILKSNYEGLDVGSRYAGADGNYDEKSVYFTAGHNITPNLNVTLSGTYLHTDPLYQDERSFSHPFYINSSTIPGVVGSNLLNTSLLSPSQTNPTGINATAPNFAALVANGAYGATTPAAAGRTYDESLYQTLLLRQDQLSANGNFNYRVFGDRRLVLYGGFQVSQDDSFTQFLPRVTGVSVPQGAPFNPVQGAVTGVEFGDTALPKQYYNDSQEIRGTLGLKGDFDLLGRDIRWDGAYVHSQDALTQQQTNLIYSQNLPLAIAGGYNAAGAPQSGGGYAYEYLGYSTTGPKLLEPALDPFARGGINPQATSLLYGSEFLHAKSILDSADLTANTNLFNVPGGPVGLAVGGGWRRESLQAYTDANGRNTNLPGETTAQNWIGGQFNDPFARAREIYSVFAEARIPLAAPGFNLPVIHALDLIIAGRFEHYSDAGDAKVPKIGFRWQPFDRQLTFRGTYSKSFTAPTLYAEYGPTDTRQAAGSLITAALPGAINAPFFAEDGNNPILKPSNTNSYSVGATFTPNLVHGLKLSVEYFHAHQTGIPGGIGFSNILLDVNQKGSNSLFYNNIARNAFPGQPGAVGFATPGALAAYLSQPGAAANTFAIDQFRNLGGIKTSAVDFNGDYLLDLGDYGSLDFSSTGTYLASYQFEVLPGQPYYEYAGTASNGGTGVQGTLPRVHVYSNATWSWRGFDFTFANTFISSVKDEGVGGLTYASLSSQGKFTAGHVDSYSVYDLRAAYHFADDARLLKGWSMAVGVNDVANTMPPLAPLAFTDNGADVATYSPIGRLVYVTANLKF